MRITRRRSFVSVMVSSLDAVALPFAVAASPVQAQEIVKQDRTRVDHYRNKEVADRMASLARKRGEQARVYRDEAREMWAVELKYTNTMIRRAPRSGASPTYTREFIRKEGADAAVQEELAKGRASATVAYNPARKRYVVTVVR